MPDTDNPSVRKEQTAIELDKQALHESEAMLRNVLDEIPDPLVLKDHDGNFLFGNRTVARLYNTTPAEMVGKQDGDFGVPKEMADFFRENVLAIMASGETQVVLEDSRDAVSGEIRHYRSIKKPLKDARGNKQILVIAQDITDIIHAQKMLVKSERRLQDVLEVTREGIWDWHVPSGKVIHNAQWYGLLGYAAGELSDDFETFGKLVYPDDMEAVILRLEGALKGQTDAYYSEHRLVCKDGTPIWIQDRGRVVERDAEGKPLRLVGSFADISMQKAHQRQLERLAHYDALTGLPNRVLLADRLNQAMVQARRRKKQLVVAYLDLDGFKSINDQYGHDVGDQLLTRLAAHIKAELREGDTFARLGGDEFVAVFGDLPDAHASVPMILRLLSAVALPVHVKGLTLHVSGSVGVSAYPQVEEVDADQLLRQADQAMYQAKLAGRNRYHVFDAEQDRSMRGHHESLKRIERGLSDNEFVLHYQPKVNLRTGQVIGMEALIRWQHPDHGLLAPADFLPVIESHRLGVELGNWVLNTALDQIEAWQRQGVDLAVSINVSAHHLQQADFAARLQASLAAHPDVRGGQLELEVLETSALDDVNYVASVISACAELGVGFSLDDFGTGYCSLTYLRHLPAGTLKIDRSFVRDMLEDPEDLAILEGVLGLAAAFRRRVIAEGVETVEQGVMLLQLGCELAQGFGIARPMPAHHVPRWVEAWRCDHAWLGQTAVSREDLPVLYACVEHRAWIAAIGSHLADQHSAPPQFDHHKCRVGKWMDGEGAVRYAAHPGFEAIQQLHLRVHELATELLALHAKGCSTAAEAGFARLLALRDRLVASLLQLLSKR
ncbi:MAG: EAL domain-containing protein [Azoarcus sp.]|nr:EAL domain-containing protein [Azoarcus sp.]